MNLGKKNVFLFYLIGFEKYFAEYMCLSEGEENSRFSNFLHSNDLELLFMFVASVVELNRIVYMAEEM